MPTPMTLLTQFETRLPVRGRRTHFATERGGLAGARRNCWYVERVLLLMGPLSWERWLRQRDALRKSRPLPWAVHLAVLCVAQPKLLPTRWTQPFSRRRALKKCALNCVH